MWRQDLGDIGEDQSMAVLEAIPSVSISTSEKLTQLFILHRAYYTHQKLYPGAGLTHLVDPGALVLPVVSYALAGSSIISILVRCLSNYPRVMPDSIAISP